MVVGTESIENNSMGINCIKKIAIVELFLIKNPKIKWLK